MLIVSVVRGRFRTRGALNHLAQLVDVHRHARQERHADLDRHLRRIVPVLIAKAARLDHFSCKGAERRAGDVVVEGGVKTAKTIRRGAGVLLRISFAAASC